jgi:hypothetical protein
MILCGLNKVSFVAFLFVQVRYIEMMIHLIHRPVLNNYVDTKSTNCCLISEIYPHYSVSFSDIIADHIRILLPPPSVSCLAAVAITSSERREL